jgi:hypothetical protein
MPKIQAEDTTQITEFKVKLRTDIQAKVLAYGAYLNPENPSSPTHVITESFNLLIAGDKDFAEFWKHQQLEFTAGKVTPKRGRPAAAKATT